MNGGRTRLALLAAALGPAVALSAWVAAAEAPLPGDLDLLRRTQDAGWLGPVSDLVNPIGGPLRYALVPAAFIIILLTARMRRAAPGPAIVALGASLVLLPLSGLLKDIVASPRPSEAYGVSVTGTHATFGFPSGHVYGDVVLLGSMAWAAGWVGGRNALRGAAGVACAVCVLAGPARVYVGAHWPSDVAGGYLWGIAALVGTTTAGELTARRSARGTASQPGGPARSAPSG